MTGRVRGGGPAAWQMLVRFNPGQPLTVDQAEQPNPKSEQRCRVRIEVVGIAETGKYVWTSEPPLDFVYLPYTQYGTPAMTLLAGSSAPDAATLAPVLREVVRRIDPAMPYSNARTMQDFFEQRAVKTTNIIIEVASSLEMMGLMLALIGLYALVAYSVSRRSREIGIRMALGVDGKRVLRMVLRQGLVPGSLGVGP